MTRPSFESIYMAFAMELAKRSTCSRLQVGCVITTSDFRQVVAIGYNGGPVGGRNNCITDKDGLVTPGGCGHLHAEINAIIGCSHTGGKHVFVTDLPCAMCATALVNLSAAKGSIAMVSYARDYRIRDGAEILAFAGIPIKQYPSNLIED